MDLRQYRNFSYRAAALSLGLSAAVYFSRFAELAGVGLAVLGTLVIFLAPYFLGFVPLEKQGTKLRGKDSPETQRAVFAVGWFWFLLAAALPIWPDHTLASVLGLACGAALVLFWSRLLLEIGVIPLGAFLISLAALPAWFALTTVTAFTFCFGFSLALLPLSEYVLTRAHELTRVRRTLTAATFGFAALGLAVGFAFREYQGFVGGVSTLAAMNLVVTLVMLSQVPEFFLRFVLWFLARLIYRLEFYGRERIPTHGPAVLIANHITFIDWFILTAACGRPVRFVMDHTIFKTPVLGTLFRFARAIPIAPAKEDAAAKEAAFTKIAAELSAGEVVAIFPEGMITYDGKMNRFRPGVERILRETPVPVVAVAMDGLWGSFFSRYGGKAMARVPSPSWRKIKVTVKGPFPSTITAHELEKTVQRELN